MSTAPHTPTPLHTELQAQLRAQRAELLERLALQRGGQLVDRAEAALDRSQPEESHALATTEREMAYAMDEHEVAELAAIDAALARIASGHYGECSDCGAPIPAARLQAAPEATRCIRCQEALEHHH